MEIGKKPDTQKKEENISHSGGYSTYLSVFMTGCEEEKEANEWKEC